MHHIIVQVALSLLIGSAFAAHAASPNARPGAAPYASDAHRAGPEGTYGAFKKNPPPPMRGAGDARDLDRKEPYNYRYYSDTNRSPGSCRRYAQRAIATNNSNWWTRYRACLQ